MNFPDYYETFFDNAYNYLLIEEFNESYIDPVEPQPVFVRTNNNTCITYIIESVSRKDN